MTARRLGRPVVDAARAGLRRAAARPSLRRRLQQAVNEMEAALRATADRVELLERPYADRYFGAGRCALDRMGLSGYERYDRMTSNADVAAYVLWKHLPVGRCLDVGCAMGFVVEALAELGADARGVDVSRYAVEHAALGARGRVRQGNILRGLPFDRAAFDVVTALEVLEHLPPDDVPAAVAELRRVSAAWMVATIPSFGPNPFGPDGWLQAKVSDEVIDDYIALGDEYDGPVPREDLWKDAEGEPIEGHLTIASFRWWTGQFEAAGFERCGEIERRMHRDIARFGLSDYWNLYVFRVPGTELPDRDIRTRDEVEELERRWQLDQRAKAVASVVDATGTDESGSGS